MGQISGCVRNASQQDDQRKRKRYMGMSELTMIQEQVFCWRQRSCKAAKWVTPTRVPGNCRGNPGYDCRAQGDRLPCTACGLISKSLGPPPSCMNCAGGMGVSPSVTDRSAANFGSPAVLFWPKVNEQHRQLARSTGMDVIRGSRWCWVDI